MKNEFTTYDIFYYGTFPSSGQDALLTVDLTIDRALSFIPEDSREDYLAAWKWFMDGDNRPGSRFFGKLLPGVKEVKHAAQRGIHVPTKQKYALSVTVKKSMYGESFEDRCTLNDGTWLFFYSAHRNNTGGDTSTTWNNGLRACMEDGVPVGVFFQTKNSSDSYLRFLAFVEEYVPEQDLFVLHGPVTPDNEECFSSPMGNELKEIVGSSLALEELFEDTRRVAEVTRAIRTGQGGFRSSLLKAYEGRCAATDCDVNEALQAAHIVDYRGSAANAVNNGLLLRADIHVLYDRALLSISPDDCRILLSDEIATSSYEELRGRRLRLPKDKHLQPREDYLEAHHKRFLALQTS